MFSQSLPQEKKLELLKIIRLLQIFDAPILWGGKMEDEITGDTNLSDISFQISDYLKELWENVVNIYGADQYQIIENSINALEKELLENISTLRINKQNNQDERLKIATTFLHTAINKDNINKKAVWPFSTSNNDISEKSLSNTDSNIQRKSRIILFEAIRLSGNLTDAKRNLLQVVSLMYKIDGESFNELLSQALVLHKEMKRSVNLVLE